MCWKLRQLPKNFIDCNNVSFDWIWTQNKKTLIITYFYLKQTVFWVDFVVGALWSKLALFLLYSSFLVWGRAKPTHFQNRPPMSWQVFRNTWQQGRCLATGGLPSILLLEGGLLNHHNALLLGCFGNIMEKPTDRTNLMRYVLLGLRFISFSLHWGRGVSSSHSILENL